MIDGQTTAPNFISEPKLIKLMDKEGIGTDATIADHIHKITARNYTVKKNGLFYPTRIGLALINGYKQMGFDFDKPKLRADLEQTMQKISKEPDIFDEERERIISQYQDAYKKVSKNVKILEDSITEQMSLPDVFAKKTKTRSKSSSGLSSSQQEAPKRKKSTTTKSRKTMSSSQPLRTEKKNRRGKR